MDKNNQRTEHLAWCKQRALDILKTGNWSQAVALMVSDLNKFPDGVTGPDRFLVGMLMLTCCDVESARRFIEGFN